MATPQIEKQKTVVKERMKRNLHKFRKSDFGRANSHLVQVLEEMFNDLTFLVADETGANTSADTAKVNNVLASDVIVKDPIDGKLKKSGLSELIQFEDVDDTIGEVQIPDNFLKNNGGAIEQNDGTAELEINRLRGGHPPDSDTDNLIGDDDDLVDMQDSTRIKQAAYSAPISIKSGHVFSWGDANLETEGGTPPISVQGITRLPGDGPNGLDAIAIEKATTNLLSSDQRNAVASAFTSYGTNVISDGTSELAPKFGTNTLKIVYQDHDYLARITNPVTLTDTDHKGSLYLFIPLNVSATSLFITTYSTFTGGSVTVGQADVSIRGRWQRISLEVNPDVGDLTGYLYLSSSGLSTGDIIYSCAWQMEASTFMTAWANGSRSDIGKADFDLILLPDYFIAGGWVKSHYISGGFQSILGFDDGAGGLWLRYEYDGGIGLLRRSTWALAEYETILAGDGNFHHIVMARNGTKIYLIVDGVSEDNLGSSYDLPTSAYLSWGNRGDGSTSYVLNGEIAGNFVEEINSSMTEAEILNRVNAIINSEGPLVQPRYNHLQAERKVAEKVGTDIEIGNIREGKKSDGNYTDLIDHADTTDVRGKADAGNTAKDALDIGEDTNGNTLFSTGRKPNLATSEVDGAGTLAQKNFVDLSTAEVTNKNTSNLSDDAGLGDTANWSEVTDDDGHKPANDADVTPADVFRKTVDTLDEITEGATNKPYTATEKSKLSGVADGAEVNTIDAGDGLAALDTAADTKLSGIETGADKTIDHYVDIQSDVQDDADTQILDKFDSVEKINSLKKSNLVVNAGTEESVNGWNIENASGFSLSATGFGVAASLASASAGSYSPRIVSDYIPIDPTQMYRFSGFFKQTLAVTGTVEAVFKVRFYSAAQVAIDINAKYNPKNSSTTYVGDTNITLSDSDVAVTTNEERQSFFIIPDVHFEDFISEAEIPDVDTTDYFPCIPYGAAYMKLVVDLTFTISSGTGLARFILGLPSLISVATGIFRTAQMPFNSISYVPPSSGDYNVDVDGYYDLVLYKVGYSGGLADTYLKLPNAADFPGKVIGFRSDGSTGPGTPYIDPDGQVASQCLDNSTSNVALSSDDDVCLFIKSDGANWHSLN